MSGSQAHHILTTLLNNKFVVALLFFLMVAFGYPRMAAVIHILDWEF